jgi:hypothetical protein
MDYLHGMAWHNFTADIRWDERLLECQISAFVAARIELATFQAGEDITVHRQRGVTMLTGYALKYEDSDHHRWNMSLLL